MKLKIKKSTAIIITVVIAFLIVFSVFFGVYYRGATSSDFYEFKLLEDNTYELSQPFNKGDKWMSPPSKYNGKQVTRIAGSGFKNQTSLRYFVIPDGVTTIGYEAFAGCGNLKKITIPNSIEYIGRDAIPEANTLKYNEYENGLYLGNKSNPYLVLIKPKDKEITSFKMNPNTKIIHSRAFWNCTLLTDIVIGENVTFIGDIAFSYCTSLTNITIPNSVTTIGFDAFYACSSLQYNEYDNTLYLGYPENPYHALIKVKDTNIISCTINSNVKCIAPSAFFVLIPTKLFDIHFNGTMEEWDRYSQNYRGYFKVYCTDGIIKNV